MTHVGAQRIIDQNEAHPTIEITEGGMGLLRLDRRSMEITLPGFQDTFHLPTHRRDFPSCFSLPYPLGHRGDTEVPRQQRQVGL